MKKVKGHKNNVRPHVGPTSMVDVVRNFQYKTAGRGRGVLGLKDLRPCRRPGEKAAGGAERKGAEAEQLQTQASSKRPKNHGIKALVIAR